MAGGWTESGERVRERVGNEREGRPRGRLTRKGAIRGNNDGGVKERVSSEGSVSQSPEMRETAECGLSWLDGMRTERDNS